MKVVDFIDVLKRMNVCFFTGVPDSLLKAFVSYLNDNPDDVGQHIVAANEGNAVALAAGYHLATGGIPCVYLQNSGLGNILNPVISLLSDKVYQIPSVFVIGWRGEPGLHDEPQHLFQGEVTLETLKMVNVSYMVIGQETSLVEVENRLEDFSSELSMGRSVAFVIRKGSLSYSGSTTYENPYCEKREDIIASIVDYSRNDLIIATTGKTSRELFEIRERNSMSHATDFLTVGSMGHSSSIALAVALNRPKHRIWCIDGDGAALMHMGSMATIGANAPKNFIHVLINNEAHESVGGQPTVAGHIDFCGIAKSCGYNSVFSVADLQTLKTVLVGFEKLQGPIFLEVKAAIGSRPDLGRPTTTPQENKQSFMKHLGSVIT